MGSLASIAHLQVRSGQLTEGTSLGPSRPHFVGELPSPVKVMAANERTADLQPCGLLVHPLLHRTDKPQGLFDPSNLKTRCYGILDGPSLA